jgi:hypothetical protein
MAIWENDEQEGGSFAASISSDQQDKTVQLLHYKARISKLGRLAAVLVGLWR